jgi:hypothetical protein
MLPWLIHPLSHKFICYSTEEIVSIVVNNVVCTVHIIRSALTTTAAIVVLGDWFPAVFASPFQLRFEEEDMMGWRGLLLGLAALLDD